MQWRLTGHKSQRQTVWFHRLKTRLKTSLSSCRLDQRYRHVRSESAKVSMTPGKFEAAQL